MKDRTEDDKQTDNLVEQEADQIAVEEATPLAPRLIYEVVRRDAREELERPFHSLIWSAMAAGGLISFSLVAEAIFRTHLPDVPGRYLIENLGYAFGFLLVIMGKMQLFTENTITTVMPLMSDPCRRYYQRAAALWGIVLTGNVIGALAAALFFTYTAALPADVHAATLAISEHAASFDADVAFARAIPAGILIAAIVWMLPQAEGAGFLLVLSFTWLIAAGDFTHIIVGSVEMWMLLLADALSPSEAAFRFFLPVLAGNIVGGTAIFSLLAWGQVREEVRRQQDHGD
ncbi:formate/nitrite transporter family protein [Psychromarinibacter sp. C21-152]|uniref:Formate/nitrite transporter family protein n=1 Tax=Psychromarinibacter sediminicola TaxID=3033385 RepID=A0AAE3NN78_9RHOB|nr:formate/nitrite transporter family protein [Psychromarinibacter sediminicola]MDF0599404.1 formate/nitrite transporter family protein [Psychromarinibacter sediminicola]